jgi:GYF domain 2
MVKKYYILINADQLGPYSAADLSGLLADGVITRLTPIKSDGRDSWFTVGDVVLEPRKRGRATNSRPAKSPPSSRVSTARNASRSAKVRSIPRLTNDYFVIANGEQSAPMKIGQLWDAYWYGRLNDRDQYWTAGLNEWMPIPALFHSGGTPYVRPADQEPEPTSASRLPGTFLSRLFSSKSSKASAANSSTDVRVGCHFPHCSYCNGPAMPRFFKCGCGTVCRQCMQEIAELCEEPSDGGGCTTCGRKWFAIK